MKLESFKSPWMIPVSKRVMASIGQDTCMRMYMYIALNLCLQQLAAMFCTVMQTAPLWLYHQMDMVHNCCESSVPAITISKIINTYSEIYTISDDPIETVIARAKSINFVLIVMITLYTSSYQTTDACKSKYKMPFKITAIESD